MYGDTGATAQDGFGSVILHRSAAPLSHSPKALLWISLAVASWAAVIFAGYCIWSTL